MTMKIDYGTALAGIEKIVSEKGEDFRYTADENTGCYSYFHYADAEDSNPSIPGCILGHWMDRDLGIHNLFEFEQSVYIPNDQYEQNTNNRPFRHVVSNFHAVSFTEKAKNFLVHVQNMQDDGVAWGEAVKIGKNFVEVNYYKDE